VENFSIARRQKNLSFRPQGEQHIRIGSNSLREKELFKIPSSVLNQTPKYQRKESHTNSMETTITDINDSLSVNLTPEQYDLVKSNRYVKYFLKGDGTGVSLDIKRQKEGQLVFNFQFKKVDIVRMLKAKHVCQMLQISNGLLMSLVKSKKIKSYKVGRLRRFLLQDVLDYLSRSIEVSGISES
jgi:excisionase family DNA binding protein